MKNYKLTICEEFCFVGNWYFETKEDLWKFLDKFREGFVLPIKTSIYKKVEDWEFVDNHSFRNYKDIPK